MSKPLSRSFFERSAVAVARDLLGCTLVRKRGKTLARLPITETEGYEGPHDLGSHASRGKTARNEAMFGPAGVWYVYFVYGNHWMLNVVTGKRGHPAAVLIRCVGEYGGPGRLTKALGIDKSFNSKPAARSTGLWLEQGKRVSARDIKRTPRIGIDYAGPVWSKKPYRFVLKKPSAPRKDKLKSA